MSEPEAPRPDDDEFPPWIDRVAGWAAAVGMNRIRVRWKLQRWHNRRRLDRNRLEQKSLHVGYQHKVCPRCTAVNDRGETVCNRCGEALHSRPRELLGRLGLRGPVAGSISTLLALLLLAVYARTAIAGAGGFSIPIKVLWIHGGNLPEGTVSGEWWRYATSVFLHAGIWHIGFNVLSLAIVGPMVEEEYGPWTTMFVFMATGIAAAIGSQQLGLDGVGIGASGAICGLLGATAAAGQRAGTPRGTNLRNDMLKWFAYVLVFGFFIGADNRAHAVGFVVGAALGLLVPRRWRVMVWPRRVGILLGVVALAAALASVALTLFPYGHLWTMLAVLAWS